MTEPTQQIYDYVFQACLDLGFATYDFLPRDDVAYPFVVVGESQLTIEPTKGLWGGGVEQVVDVYGDSKSRRAVSEMAHDILTKSRLTAPSRCRLVPSESYIDVQQDQQTSVDLWHASIVLTYEF